MKYALVNKWNHYVRSVENESQNLNGSENFYEVATEFNFQEPVGPDIYKYEDGEFTLLSSRVMENIDARWQTANLYADYKLARVALFMTMMQKGGFNALTLAEKQIASKWFIVEKLERTSVHTLEEQVMFGIEYNANSIKARKQRLTKCMVEVYNRLAKSEVVEVIATSKFNETAYKYTELGQEGTLEGDSEGLNDYIDARVGTQWELTGLRSRNYVPEGMSNCGQLADRLLDIIKNGNY